MPRRLRADERGVAFIEMALVLPVILLLGLGGIELARYVLCVLRMEQIAETVADNAGRVRQALDESDVNEVMIGANLIGSNLNFSTNGRIILSDLEQRTNTTGGAGTVTTANPNGYRQWIRWQRCAGALAKTSSYGTPLDSSGAAVTNLDSTTNADHGAVETKSLIDGMGPTGGQIAATAGTAVMVAEVFYTYQPIVSFYGVGTQTLHTVQAFNIRQRTDFSIYNANSLSDTARSDCRLFNASVPTS